MKNLTLGIDIGGTNTAFGFVDREGNCLISASIPTKGFLKFEDYLDSLCSSINETKDNCPEKFNLVGIGVGAPNANYYKGTIEYAPNLDWKGIIPFVKLMKTYFNLPIALTNDANAAAIGEMIYGAAKGFKDFIVITLGTGLGSGVVVNNELVYGHDGFAGELGHVNLFPNGRECGCGRLGCLETYVSATGIIRTVYELLSIRSGGSVFRSISYKDISASDVYEAAIKGDSIAIEAFETTGKYLGTKLSDFVAFSSPEAIILFGGLAKAGSLIFNPTYKAMEDHMMNIFKNKVKLIPSGLESGNSAILGASALAWKELNI